MAKAAVSHFGATTCPVTEELSKTRLDRSETACHNVSFGLIFTITFRLWIWGLGCFQETSAIHSWPFPKPRFREQGLALDIPISWIDLPKGDLKFPILRMTDTVSYMCKHDCLNKLMGDMPNEKMEQTLLTFWRRFSLQHADHEVFSASEAGKLSLSRTVPVMIHGDEGRASKELAL